MVIIAQGEYFGATVAQIAEKLPVSESTVRRAMRKADYLTIRDETFRTLVRLQLMARPADNDEVFEP